MVVSSAPAPVSISNLPPELLLHIFSFLTPKELCKYVTPVCCEWKHLSKNPTLWKKLYLHVNKEKNNIGKLAPVLLRCPMLSELRINTWSPLVPFANYAIACPVLKHLHLGYCLEEDVNGECVIDSDTLDTFARNCPLLEELNVAGCRNMDDKATSAIIRLKHLRVLNLQCCYPLGDECIRVISENCSRLEELNLVSVRGLTDKSFHYVAENLKSTLRSLDFDGELLTDSAYESIGLCTKLELLYICNGTQLTSHALDYLKKLTCLKGLGLQLRCCRAPQVVTVAMNNFFAGRHVQNLKDLYLDCTGIDDVGVYNITQTCKVLDSLSLIHHNKITEVGLEHIVKHCLNLHVLKLDGMDGVTGQCLISVPEKLKCLQYLEIKQCSEIIQSVLDVLESKLPELNIDASTGRHSCSSSEE